MSAPAYIGTAERTFAQALIHMLEENYSLLGSRRVLELLVKDVQVLVNEFYPAQERLSNGWMVFTGTKAKGDKVYPGQRASQHELVTLAWPVLLPEDLQFLITHGETKQARWEATQLRLVRILEYGWNHAEGPVLLTLADLAVMLNIDTLQVSKALQEARRQTGKPLLTKGYYFDQGMRPTHKDEIIALYEAGLDEAAVARKSGHAPKSVGQYIRDYERVKLLISKHTPVGQIAQLIDMQPGVVKAYAGMVQQYHPEISLEEMSPLPQH